MAGLLSRATWSALSRFALLGAGLWCCFHNDNDLGLCLLLLSLDPF